MSSVVIVPSCVPGVAVVSDVQALGAGRVRSEVVRPGGRCGLGGDGERAERGDAGRRRDEGETLESRFSVSRRHEMNLPWIGFG